MKENWHNKELQDGLGAYDSPMDLGKAWNDLESRRKPKKDKRRFFFLWFLGLVGLVSIVSYLLLQNDGSELDRFSIANKNQVEEQLSKLRSGKEDRINSDIERDASKDETQKNNIAQDWNNKNTIAANKLNNNSIVRRERATKNSDLFQTKLNNNSITNRKEKLNVELKPQNDLMPKEANPTLNMDIKRLSQKASTTKALENRFEDRNHLLLPKATISNELNALVFPSIPFQFNGFDLAKKTKGKLVDPASYDGRKKYQKKAGSNIGLSSSYGFRTAGVVQKEEKPLDAMMFTAFYERFISNRFYLKTGLSFQQFTTELNATEINNSIVTEDDLLLVVNQYIDGSSSQEYGLGEVRYKETKSHQTFNRYRFVSIPFLAGYEIPIFGRSSLHLETGFATSIISTHSGNVIQNGSISSFEESSTFESRNIGILQSVSAVHYQVKVGNQLSLFLGGQANFHLNESVDLEEENGQRFRFFGLSFGGKFSL